MFVSGFAQFSKPLDTLYEPKPLKIDEINLVSSYYNQHGNHSPIMGGIGNEHVVDFSNGIDIKLVGQDMNRNKHTLNLGLGIDHHTAASAAYVSKTGASNTGGTRIYPSINWNKENISGNSFGAGLYYSAEYNYKSMGLELHAAKKINSNTEINGKASAFFDRVKMIYPSELIPPSTTTTRASGSGDDGIPSSSRNTFTASLAIAQIVNTRMQLSATADFVGQNGYLGLPFHRVYFKNGVARVENLPSVRLKLPIGFRLNYFVGDRFIIRSFYRYYIDDWGIKSHTAQVELPIKVTSFFSVAPFYRYYTQTAATYFAPYQAHTSADKYYTSNYSLSKLTSRFIGVNIHAAPAAGILNKHLSALDVRYGHYTQSTDLYANVLTFAFTFK
jgi:hypothetical protein